MYQNWWSGCFSLVNLNEGFCYGMSSIDISRDHHENCFKLCFPNPVSVLRYLNHVERWPWKVKVTNLRKKFKKLGRVGWRIFLELWTRAAKIRISKIALLSNSEKKHSDQQNRIKLRNPAIEYLWNRVLLYKVALEVKYNRSYKSLNLTLFFRSLKHTSSFNNAHEIENC